MVQIRCLGLLLGLLRSLCLQAHNTRKHVVGEGDDNLTNIAKLLWIEVDSVWKRSGFRIVAMDYGQIPQLAEL